MKKLTILASLLAALFSTMASAANLVANGSFESTTLATKGTFYGNVADWSGGKKLTFLNFPGTATTAYLEVYAGFPAVSPDGGNFVEMDGDPSYSSAIYQTIQGLTVGKTYAVTFDQAAGQQAGFHGPTTERWAVTLGSTTQLSSKYSLAQGATGPWQAQKMNFTATSASEVLSFLAVGTPAGQPPISFLDGVSLVAVPEPATWAMMIIGLGAMGIAARRQRRILTTA
jgi:hypothetical protein